MLFRSATLDRLRSDKVREGSWTVSRFKGLGEMNPDQLWETTLNPETRRLIALRSDDFAGPNWRVFNTLMGKGEAAGRRAWMEQDGDQVEAET